MKCKGIVITVVIALIVAMAASCVSFIAGYNHVIKNQHMELCADYDDKYYMVVDGQVYLYDRVDFDAVED